MKYVEFCMNMLTMLQDHGGKVLLLLCLHLFTSTNPTLQNIPLSLSPTKVIDITVVFDGSGLPVKGNKCRERGALREFNRAKAQELVDQGKDDEAQKHFQRSVVVTAEMVQQVETTLFIIRVSLSEP